MISLDGKGEFAPQGVASPRNHYRTPVSEQVPFPLSNVPAIRLRKHPDGVNVLRELGFGELRYTHIATGTKLRAGQSRVALKIPEMSQEDYSITISRSFVSTC